MSNPFDQADNPDGRYVVLVNDEGRHSLWPSFAQVPAGWTVAHGEDERQVCLDHLDETGPICSRGASSPPWTAPAPDAGAATGLCWPRDGCER